MTSLLLRADTRDFALFILIRHPFKNASASTKVHSRLGYLPFCMVKGSALHHCLMIHKSFPSQYRQEGNYLVLPFRGHWTGFSLQILHWGTVAIINSELVKIHTRKHTQTKHLI